MDAAVVWLERRPRALRPRRLRGRNRAARSRSPRGKPARRPYFSLSASEVDGQGVLQPRIRREPPARAGELTAEDLLATLTAASAESIAAALRRLDVAELVVAGGGTRNPCSWRSCSARLAGASLRSIEEFGIPEAAKEALVFAAHRVSHPERTPGHGRLPVPAPSGLRCWADHPGAHPLPIWPVPVPSMPTRLIVRTPLAAEMSVLPTETSEALGQGEALLSFRDVRIGMRHRGHCERDRPRSRPRCFTR